MQVQARRLVPPRSRALPAPPERPRPPRAHRSTEVALSARELARVLRMYALSRAAVLGTAVVTGLALRSDPAAGPWPAIGAPHLRILRGLARWDAAWYLDIASHGYHATHIQPGSNASLAFFPSFPLSVRAVSATTRLPPLVAAVALAMGFGAIAAVTIWVLVRRVSGEAAANRATALVCWWPGAMVLSMPYAEALLLAASAACLLALLDRRWVIAGIAAAVATATRANGIAAVVACVICAVVVLVREGDRRALVAPAIAPLGVVGYFGWLVARTHDPLEWFVVEHTSWQDRFAPLASLTDRIHRLPSAVPSLSPGGLNELSWWLGLVLVGIGVVALLRWRPPLAISAYGIAAVAASMASLQVGPRPRMILAAFPLLLAAGVIVSGRRYRILLGLFVIGTIALSAVTFATLAATP